MSFLSFLCFLGLLVQGADVLRGGHEEVCRVFVITVNNEDSFYFILFIVQIAKRERARSANSLRTREGERRPKDCLPSPSFGF